MWMGPKLNMEEQSASSKFIDILTNYENSSSITRTRVRRGHEEESLLSLFPSGFITLHGKRQPIHETISVFKSNGALFRVQAPYGAGVRAIQ